VTLTKGKVQVIEMNGNERKISTRYPNVTRTIRFPAEAPTDKVIDEATGDVTGDQRLDQVILTGRKTEGSPYIEGISLSIKEGGTSKVWRIRLPEPSGYNPRISLADFTGSGYKDVLVQIDSGGSGAFTYDDIYHFEKGEFRPIFNSEHFNEQWTYTVDFMPDYKLRVTSSANNQTYTIDISGRDQTYLNQIYRSDGTLIKPVQGFVDPISGLYPVDTDRDGKYSLMTFQGVSGLYHADRYGYMVSILSWNGNGWTLQDQWFAINGM
jgi:hypothetical protein